MTSVFKRDYIHENERNLTHQTHAAGHESFLINKAYNIIEIRIK